MAVLEVFVHESDLPGYVLPDLPPGEPIHVQVYLQNPCTQHCVFCTYPAARDQTVRRALRRAGEWVRPPARRAEDTNTALDRLLRTLAARTPSSIVTITGNDWTLHPARDALIARLSEAENVRVAFLGPAVSYAEPGLVEKLAAMPNLEAVRVSWFSSDRAVHDAISGTPGSAARVEAALDRLHASGIRTSVNVVLVTPALDTLAETLGVLVARGLGASVLAFVPDRGPRGWPPPGILPSAPQIHAALARVPMPVRDETNELHGLPPCAVPQDWPRVPTPPVSAERAPLVHAPACAGCSARARCPGVPEAMVRIHGAQAVRPLSRA